MPSEEVPAISSSIPKGTYAPSSPSDKRSPCPMVNCLANHGYIPRDGRNIHAKELQAAMYEVGLSATLGALFTNSVFNVHHDPKTGLQTKKKGFLGRVWSFIRNPWTILSRFGMRRPDQTDAAGVAVLDLDQLGLPGVIEHDISLSRRDHLQKEGNTAPQPDLIKDILACSRDGKTLTMEDLAIHRKRRIEQQRSDNPGLRYGPLEHELSCGEIALILKVFGDGKSVPCDYARAFFQEERLPVKEGWMKRTWWTLGLPELKLTASKVKRRVGLKIE